jgi:hypothetical protein
MLLNVIRLIFIFAISFNVNAQGSLQNPDFKTVQQLQSQGLTEGQAKAQMLHDSKVYVTADGLNKLLNEAINDGDLRDKRLDVLTTNGDLLYYDSGPDRLRVGDEGQILTVNQFGFPDWLDPQGVSPTTTQGDLIIRGATEDERLPIGSTGKVLTSNGTTATWENAPSTVSVTEKGQLQTHDDQNPTSLQVGSDGFILSSNGETDTGLEWISFSDASPTTTRGDLIIRGINEDERLPIGDAGKVLTSNGTTATWEDTGQSLPSQTSQNGNVLTTNGSTASWIDVDNRTNTIKNNLISCATFNGCTATEWVVTTNAGTNLSGIGSRSEEQAANNTNILKLDAINIPSSPWNIKALLTKSQNFEGQQMLAFCEVKTLRPNTFFIVGANTTEQSRKEIISDGKWRYYEIPFIGGNTSQFIEVNGETTSSLEPVSIDNCFMGKVSPEYFRQIDIAMTDWQLFTPFFVNVNPGTNFVQYGYKRRIGGNLEIKAGFRLGAGGSLTGNLSMTIPDGLTIDTAKLGNAQFIILGEGTIHDTGNDVFNTKVLLANNTNVLFRYLFDQSANSTNAISTNLNVNATQPMTWVAGDEINFLLTVPIVGWSVETNTIVTQNTELTAQTANEFVAFVSGGTVSRENFDWINGNCSSSTGIRTCNFVSGLFDNSPICSVTVQTSQGDRHGIITALSSTSITVTTGFGSYANADYPFHLNCTRSTDYRKSATIIGKFEQISKEVIRPNHIINGNFDFWQRGTSLGSAAGARRIADRFRHDSTGSTYTVSRQTITQPSTELFNARYFMRKVVTSSAGASNRTELRVYNEDVTKFACKQLTLSFWAKADANKNIAIEFFQEFGGGGSPSAIVNTIGVTTHSLTTSWQKFTQTVTFPCIDGKTLGTDGIETSATALTMWLDCGSSFASRCNSLGNQSGTFDIAQVKLEEGDTATPFVLAGGTIEGELAACQRYYEILTNAPNGNTSGMVTDIARNTVNGDAAGNINSMFRVKKRIVPTVTLYGVDGTGTSPNTVLAQGASSSAVAEAVGLYGFRRIRNTSGITWSAGQVLGYNWVADAEF